MIETRAGSRRNVFVSYSHADASIVAPVVKLLRVNRSLVFQDVDDIRPGKRWRGEIAGGIARSELVVIFWCEHANRSDEVHSEWTSALEQEKDLLPLLLDGTPLPPELGEYQWIDFRGAVGADHGSSGPPKGGGARVLVALLLLAGIAGVIYVGVNMFGGHSSPPIPSPRPTPPGSPGWARTALIAIVAISLVLWLWRRRSRSKPTPSRPREREVQMANEIATEILRRTEPGSRQH